MPRAATKDSATVVVEDGDITSIDRPGCMMMNPWTVVLDACSSKLAFFPPTPPSYTLSAFGRADGREFCRMHPDTMPGTKYEACKVQGRRGSIVTMMLPYRTGEGPVLLFSHGNAVDLGIMMPFYADLVELLQISVCSYDYSGYGCSSGTPSVSNTLADVQVVLNWLREDKGKKPHEIVLYGQSVGSGPSIHCAASNSGLAGLILHSPLLSGLRVLYPGLKQWWPSFLDVFNNQDYMPKVQCPVFVMHVRLDVYGGTDDEVVPVSHGKRLSELAPNSVQPLFAPGYDHQNLHCSPQYILKLREFLTNVLGIKYTHV